MKKGRFIRSFEQIGVTVFLRLIDFFVSDDFPPILTTPPMTNSWYSYSLRIDNGSVSMMI